jgi:hypothetical protein
MKKLFKLVLVTTLILTMGVQLHAQGTAKISVQGTLKDASGSAVADGNYSLIFKLYNSSTGGTAFWEETAQVSVLGGIYSHLLGSINSLTASNFNDNVYLGVTIGNFELSPRSEMTYSPYSFYVANAGTAQKVTCSGAVGDVKYSVLNPTEFAAENGDCWVPMDGRPLSPGDKLRIASGMTSVPNAGGLFIRSQDFANSDNDPDRDSNSPVATIQGDNFKSHNHNITDPGHSHRWLNGTESDDSGSGGSNAEYTRINGIISDVIENSVTNITINNTGGNETRPKNINLWTYIRIN